MRPSEAADYQIAGLEMAAAIQDMHVRSIDQFIGALPERMGVEARETQQLHGELQRHMVESFTETDMRLALAHAQWIREHIGDVIYRWRVLMSAYERWVRLDVRPMVVTLSRNEART